MIKKKIVIIGAGISGITCAQTLLRNNFLGNITVLEIGNNHLERFCEVDNGNICKNCNPCNTISGFGGSVHYGDTVKLSGFPSGKRLQEIIGIDNSFKAQTTALSNFLTEISSFLTPHNNLSHLIKKKYPIGTLNSDKIKSILNAWYENLKKYKNFNIYFRSEFTEVKKIKNKFELTYKLLKDNSIHSIECDFLVFANGRKGFKWLNNNLSKLGIDITDPKISIGFRFIMPNYILEKVSNLHPDFKVSLYNDNFKYKTFCFSAGNLGGRIKHANHGKYTLIDGHSITNEKDFSKLSNFGILSQIKNNNNENASIDWINENILNKYIELNKHYKGKPIVQSYFDFKNKTISNSSFDHQSRIANKIYGVGDLSSLIPEKQHLGFCKTLEQLILEFCRISKIDEPINDILDKITVMGLELESIWNEVKVTSQMQTSINNIYAIGDCSGIAQGVLQASIGGVIAAYGIMDKKI